MSLGGSGQSYIQPITPGAAIAPPSWNGGNELGAASAVDTVQRAMMGRSSTLATGGMGTMGSAPTFRPRLGGAA